jgi:glycosyltransferase involved in cell wall biosynthesis
MRPDKLPAGRISLSPAVSVVISNYNRRDDLARCLASLRRQTCNDFEVIVCDDGSTDDSAAVAESFMSELDLIFDRGDHWGGPARPRNRGTAIARAPYIAFLDVDDWWAPQKLAACMPFLERGADVVYHDLFLVTRHPRQWLRRRVRANDVRSPVLLDLLSNGNAVPLSSAVVRRDILIRSGGMPDDRRLIAFEDYVCWLNVAKVTDNFVRVPGVFGYYWAGGGNTSNDKRTFGFLEVFESTYGDLLESAYRPRTPWWVTYARARIHYRSQQYAAARQELQRLRGIRIPSATRAKVAAMNIALALR